MVFGCGFERDKILIMADDIKRKSWFKFVSGFLIGIVSGILLYTIAIDSTESIQEFLNHKFSDFPMYMYEEDVFLTADNGYFIAFYSNPYKQFAAAVFKMENLCWSKNYIKNSGTINLPDGPTPYPVVSQEFFDSLEKHRFVWGVVSDLNVDYVQVCGKRVTMVELDSMKLWFSITSEMTNDNEVIFLDGKNEIIHRSCF